ncbi:class I SAM-dependent methyltransferase [Pseudofrankia sp. BMG5.36]|uniref:class I SAM-dependent methyltransferase n=1 Tax=Pseudofrankia sp. BMG5.36 TaxID=1834512 RepID=UPI0008DB2C91|nr:class I SAM-dependent methyltransferase [Pseudofrankia sp. BMG5.36]OHV62905.1 methyltransferase type 11 [Pseudofrankia sp. BMG5.36]
MASGSETSAHYERLAGSYDENWAYSEAFLDWMSGAIAGSLDLTPGDRVADVGCGTGLFAGRLLDVVGPSARVLCVDPSTGMLGQLPQVDGLVAIHASAEDLAGDAAGRGGGATGRSVLVEPSSLDAVVVKEAIHHVAAADRSWVVAGLADLLAPGGRLLVVMLPTTISYPLFDGALLRFEELQPDPEAIAAYMRDAGLAVTVGYQEFELRIPKDRYLGMVRSRYMSLLAMFDDDELAAGIAEIDARYPGPVLVFPDRFAFVVGRRDGGRR